jgi:hypothetical protein
VSHDRWGKKHWLGFCNACNGVILVADNGARIYPFPLPTPTDIRIPEELRKDLDESKMCFSVDCFRACSVLARRCVQQACKKKGAKKEDLVDQIKELASSRTITEEMAEWASVVRWIGNDAAHPNASEVSKEEAEDCLRLAEQFLHVLFVTPAIAKERIEKREKSSKE